MKSEQLKATASASGAPADRSGGPPRTWEPMTRSQEHLVTTFAAFAAVPPATNC